MKHLKLFQTEAEYTAYKNGSDFITPNVSYAVDNTKTFYSPQIEISGHNVGDICLSNANGDKKFIKVGQSIPDGYEPIGVVVIPSSHDVYGTGECAVISLKYMNNITPNEGSVTVNTMRWGGYLDDISTLTNYNQVPYIAAHASEQTDTYSPTIIGMSGLAYLPSDNLTGITCGHDTSAKYYEYYDPSFKPAPSPYLTDGSRNPLYYQTSSPSTTANALSDFDGVGNTKILTDLATGEDWKTATNIHNYGSSNYYPAACCCWRYHTTGTNQGNWYLPACGELGYVAARLKTINNAIQYLKDSGFSDSCSLVDSNSLLSSSENDKQNARYLSLLFGRISGGISKMDDIEIRAFLRVK